MEKKRGFLSSALKVDWGGGREEEDDDDVDAEDEIKRDSFSSPIFLQSQQMNFCEKELFSFLSFIHSQRRFMRKGSKTDD